MHKNKSMDLTVDNVKLIMWESSKMPNTTLVDGIRTKTGGEQECSVYTFKDEWGSKLIFLSQKNDFRTSEGKDGSLTVKVKYDDFKRKNVVQFVNFEV